MINGAHVIIHSRDAEADRAFIRDVLGFPHVDAGHGWLIFKLPPAELATHPAEDDPRHEFYLMCDDIQSTLEGLGASGVQVDVPVTEHNWGLLTAIRLPSGGELPLYEPRHPMAKDL